MNRWEYLKAEPFLTRYVIAARWLRDCMEIIEVGGYQNCIADFLPRGQPYSVFAVDPLLEWTGERAICIKKRIQDVDINEFRLSRYGLLMLGFDIMDESQDKIVEMAKEAAIMVVEYPLRHLPSVRKVTDIITRANLEIKMRVLLNLEGNSVESSEKYPPFWERQMFLLERHK